MTVISRRSARVRQLASKKRRLFLEGLEVRNLLAPIVANPSFEMGTNPGVGYGPISGWTVVGGTGVNPSSTPNAFFLNGLTVPDGVQVAFIQGSGGSISQSVSGFDIGRTYVVQYFENERGAENQSVATPFVRVNGELVVGEHNRVRNFPGFVQVTSLPFVATSTTMTLILGNDDPATPLASAADNSVLFDNVQIIEVTEPYIANATFEPPAENLADNPWPGYGPISGWTRSNGSSGINPAGTSIGAPPFGTEPFLNGKQAPDGRYAAFAQNNPGGPGQASNISQNVGGFVIGQTYVLEYYEAERGGGAVIARPYARVGGQIVVEEHDLISLPQGFVRQVSKPFVATATTLLLELGNNDLAQPGDSTGDNTVSFDRIRIRPVAASPTPTLFEGGFEETVQRGIGDFEAFKQANGTGNGTLNGSAWIFANGGGLTHDISAFQGGGIQAPQGNQFAMLQHTASMSTTVRGFVPGNTYNLSFQAAMRNSDANVTDIYDVLLDGAPIYSETWNNNGGANFNFSAKFTNSFVATKDTYVITFNTADQAGDETTFIDAVQVNLVSLPDYGDAPNSYATLLASNGPRHSVIGTLRLGPTIDGEADGQPSVGATGDGADEDGVTISPIVAFGNAAVVATVTGGPGRLDAWIDWNVDGDFGDPGEQIATNLLVNTGANTINVPVPAAAAVGAPTTTYARFRLSSVGSLPSTGLALNGEVEDYAVTLNPPRPVVYVDPTYTTVGADPDAGGPATSVGFDAFSTYTQAIAVLQAGGTIVSNGTVVENVTINKSLTIDGSGTGTTTIQGNVSTTGALMGVTLREFSISVGGLSVPGGAGVGILNLFDIGGGTGSSIAGTVGTVNLTTTDGADTVNFSGVGAGGTFSTNKLNSVAFGAATIGTMSIVTFQSAADVSDSITVAPDENTPVSVSAGNPVLPIIGDLLNLNLTGLTPPLVVSATTNGSLTATGRAAVTWLSIEDVDISGVPQIPVINIGDVYALGTAGNDPIVLSRGPTAADIKVRIGGFITPALQPTGKVVVHAGNGTDSINASNLTLPVEIFGQDGDDYISGAAGNDLLVGGAGSDRINASLGDNIVWGDNLGEQDLVAGGNDTLSALGGSDVFYGGGGNDSVSAGGGVDYAYGGEGDDSLQGSDGDDRLYGGNGVDLLAGGTGNDLLSGGGGNDTLIGDSGNDVLFGGGGADTLNGSDGNDLMVAGSVANEASSTVNDANDLALIALLGTWGGSGSNRAGLGAITQGTDIDTLSGGAGDDDFSVVIGVDILVDFAPPGDETF